eukprot:gene1579-2834_t
MCYCDCISFSGDQHYELCSLQVLSQLKDLPCSSSDRGFRDVVVTVPSSFGDSQRQATKDAAGIAGFNVVRLVDEPTAAAIAHVATHPDSATAIDLCAVHVGGGCTGTSLLTVTPVTCGGVEVQVRATGGTSRLGGAEFDTRLLDHCLKVVEEQHGVDVTANAQAHHLLRLACERAKRHLSSSPDATVEAAPSPALCPTPRSMAAFCVPADVLEDGNRVSIPVTRQQFEFICADLFDAIVKQTERALIASGIGKEKNCEILMAGGASQMPRLAAMLTALFDGKQPLRGDNPEEAAVCGAAALASSLNATATADP